MLGLAVLVIELACTRPTSTPPSTPPSEAQAPTTAAPPPAAASEPSAAEATPPPPDVPPDADAPPPEVASEGAADPSSTTPQLPKAPVKGYDKDVIRRVVRAHLHEVRSCYIEELETTPALKGRATLQFAIGPEGSVVASVPVKLEPESEALGVVADCAAEVIRRWTFPKPESGGSVVITYPFVFEPG